MKIKICILIFIFSSQQLFAQQNNTDIQPSTTNSENLLASPAPIEKRSLFWIPSLSLIIPGLGQAIDGQSQKSLILAGYAGAGILIVGEIQNRRTEFEQSSSLNFHHYRDLERAQRMAGHMYSHAGYLSAYDTFIHRLPAYQKEGQYTFVPKDQNLETVLKAPFEFSHLTKWTTWLPLTAALAVGLDHYSDRKPKDFDLRPIDTGAAGYISYVAGTGEEALFRGYAFPVLYQHTSPWIAHSIQALAFGYAHGPEPYFQIAAGFYFGWLTERNHFSLSEAIFIHTWWDVAVILADFARTRGHTRDYDLQIPLLQTTF